MDELRRKVASVRRRLALFKAIEWGMWGLIAALSMVALLVLGLKFFPGALSIPPIAAAVVVLGVAVSMVAAVVRRQTLFEAALRADISLNLRERISSALVLAERHPNSTNQALHAVEQDAVAFARAIQPRRDFPFRVPRHSRYLAIPLVALAALYFMPEYALFQEPPPPPKNPAQVVTLTPEQRREQAERMKELAQKVAKKEVETNATGEDMDLAEKLERLSKDFELGTRTERELVAEMSRLQDEVKLEQRELQKQAEPFRQLRGLNQANQTRDLQSSLKSGNYQQAAQQMQQLAEQLQQLTPEQKEQLAQELQNMAEQLKDNPAMSEAMQQAADALSQPQQQQSSQQQGGQQQQPQQQNQNQQGSNSEQASAGDGGQQQQQQQQQPNQTGQGGQQGQQSQGQEQQSQQSASAAMQQAAQAMQDMQQMQQQMQQLSQLQNSLDASMQQCMGGQQPGGQGKQQAAPGQGSPQQGQGQQLAQGGDAGMQSGQSPGQGSGQSPGQSGWSPGTSEASSLGSGGPGRGQGAVPMDSEAMPMGFVDVFIPGQQNEGEIIAVFEVDAMVPKGESTVTYRNVPAEIRQNAADTIGNREIPVGYRNAVKQYFEAINFESGQ